MSKALKRTAPRALITIGLALAIMPPAAAQDVLLYRRGEVPDPAAIARILRPEAVAAESSAVEDEASGRRVLRMRGLKLTPQSGSAPSQAPGTTAALAADRPESAPRAPGAFALQIQFPFDSAEIQPEMVAPLDAVAEGIRRSGDGTRIVLEGHTDAVGSADYNLHLSKRRAEAVRNYLVIGQGLAPQRFVVIGRGKYAPLIPENPYAPENRRVQFRPAGAS